MSITNITPRETDLQKQVIELAESLRSLGWEFELYKTGARATHQKLLDQIHELKAKLAKFDRPLPTTAELFEIYCNDKLAGDWHRAQQNYEAGFIAALKWLVQP